MCQDKYIKVQGLEETWLDMIFSKSNAEEKIQGAGIMLDNTID